jgi:LysR family transcriptional regulator, nitrogen assimilation regulatory protein
MQFRQLRYFVKIVEAGSFSRAASVVHVAQPALSQQVAELEERLGVTLLQRSARGVLPTAAGEILYKEASVILHKLDQLPSIARSDSSEPEGTVSIGFVSSLAPRLVGGLLDECRTRYPKITLRVSDGDSLGIESKIASNAVNLAVVYEDEFVTALIRKPLFRQKMYLISRTPLPGLKDVVSCERLAEIPLVLPAPTNGRRVLIERVFAEAKLTINLALEADSLGSDMSHFGPNAFAKPLLVEPPMHLTCSIVHSADLPLTTAGEAVREFLIEFIERRVGQTDMPGVEWIAKA